MTRQRVSIREALELIMDAMPLQPAERVPLFSAVGRTLRETIMAERDQPPFDRVTMDGIALAHRDWAAGTRSFRVAGTQGAGAAPLALDAPGACIEVMTGSALPAGADCIVPVERLSLEDGVASIEAAYEPRPGTSIHRRGSDYRQGAVLLAPGARLGAAQIAVATLGGSADIAVSRQPRIAIASTGDELVPPGAAVGPASIRASNDRAIEAALRLRGHPVEACALLPDDPAVLRSELGRMLEGCEVLIVSGGVSMGQYDHVPATLTALGVEPVFHKVTQRPGLPLWFGRKGADKVVFALPGNPVSSLVCTVRYVLPALAQALGARAEQPRRVALAEAVEFRPDLSYLLPVVVMWRPDGTYHAVPRPTNTSGDFVALAGTDGFVELPRGQDLFPAGYVAPFFRW
ncbi:MAG: molybdopterin molybdotransferase MoeA [Gammaproteobacteria bacterium]|nr:molybdopterin molybdotransferase MoeA [Gammaproteobacteria bacterium]